MGIAQNSHYWTARVGGTDPAVAIGENNTVWSLSGSGSDGAVTGDAWRISGSGQTWSQTVANDDNDLTIMCAMKYISSPDDNEVLITLDNGSHRVQVKANGAANKLKLVGATTVTTDDLDLGMAEEDAVPSLLRLTLASDGTARLYMREIIEDDDATQHYLQITGASSASQTASFGNTTGSVDWYVSYFTPHGAYSPDEMDMSDWTTNSLLRTGINIVNVLKASNRFLLKTHVTDAAILYGYDLSSQAMISRIHPPSVHVLTQKLDSPEFLTLGGRRTDQRYNVMIYVTTRGTDYKNAYRQGLSIMGEVFDELYTKTGLEGGIDSLLAYDATLDSKLDDDEIVCVHTLTLTYMKKVRMFLREV
tara:strand:- start:962 stop:2050 length:1089 start_codon:yes stop_codon:yes gene_type:complete